MAVAQCHDEDPGLLHDHLGGSAASVAQAEVDLRHVARERYHLNGDVGGLAPLPRLSSRQKRFREESEPLSSGFTDAHVVVAQGRGDVAAMHDPDLLSPHLHPRGFLVRLTAAQAELLGDGAWQSEVRSCPSRWAALGYSMNADSRSD